jgi:hypothetical protein
MDAIKHANHAGTAPLGGVLALVGDDHLGKSSAFGHQSEFAFVDAMIPVIAPADLDEVLEFGLFGFALSRFCGSWVGMKLAGSLCESSATVRLPDAGRGWPAPQNYTPPPGGLHLRWPDDPLAMEDRTRRHRREAALAFIRAAGLDRIEGAAGPARLGIVAHRNTTRGALVQRDPLRHANDFECVERFGRQPRALNYQIFHRWKFRLLTRRVTHAKCESHASASNQRAVRFRAATRSITGLLRDSLPL